MKWPWAWKPRLANSGLRRNRVPRTERRHFSVDVSFPGFLTLRERTVLLSWSSSPAGKVVLTDLEVCLPPSSLSRRWGEIQKIRGWSGEEIGEGDVP